VIGSLIRKAIRYPQEGFVVWGDGTQRRCFVFIDDALDALMRLERYVAEHGSLTVNIGSTEEVTVRDLARMVVALSKKDIPLTFDESRPTGALNRTPSLERVMDTLGWSPKTPFASGLRKTFDWAAARLNRWDARQQQGAGSRSTQRTPQEEEKKKARRRRSRSASPIGRPRGARRGRAVSSGA
jgi:nucleoside-diphosphate-sugar epimerase